jgi:hypothetical protein
MPDANPVLRLFLPVASPPALVRLRSLIPGLVTTPIGLEIPLQDLSAEEVLSILLRCGVTARATRILPGARSG